MGFEEAISDGTRRERFISDSKFTSMFTTLFFADVSSCFLLFFFGLWILTGNMQFESPRQLPDRSFFQINPFRIGDET